MATGSPRNFVEGSAAGAPVSMRGRSCQRAKARRFSASVYSSSAPPSRYASTSGASDARAASTASSRTTKGGGSGAGAFIEPGTGGRAAGRTDLVQELLPGPIAGQVVDEQVDDAPVAREPAGGRVGREHDAGVGPERAVGGQRLGGEHVEARGLGPHEIGG